MPEALVRLRAKLAGLAEPAPLTTFLSRMPPHAGDRALLARSAVGSPFLAALELSRLGEAAIIQAESFAPIQLGPAPAVGTTSQ